MTNFEPMDLLAPIRIGRPFAVTGVGVLDRLRLTLISAGYAASFVPCLVLAILTVVSLALIPAVGVGLLGLALIYPATAGVIGVHRRLSGRLIEEEIVGGYASTENVPALVRPIIWLRDPARWREFGFLWFSASGGFVMSLVPVALLTMPLTWFIVAVADPGWAVLAILLLLSGPVLAAWWFVTPPLVRARALTERAMLGNDRVAHLERRVEKVEESRAETLDHSAAEVRRIERDLHDGAQARIASVGMNVGLAEKLIHTDPAAAAELLREARETTIDALEDLRGVVRGIHPPVLADKGLSGAIQAIALALPVPTSVALDVPRLPAPVESAAYFAIAECLANTVKHAGAGRAWVTGRYDGDRLRITVGDDGQGVANAAGSGLSGVARRLDAFDGDLRVLSPVGGPTLIELEIPCRIS